jgi:thioredoxin 1
MSWIGLVVLVVVGAIVLFQLNIILQSKRMVGRQAPEVGDSAVPEQGRELIYFYSPRCRSCRSMTPVIEEMARQGEPAISVDISRDLESARRYNVRATPTTVLVLDGKIEKVLLGALSTKKLKHLLA